VAYAPGVTMTGSKKSPTIRLERKGSRVNIYIQPIHALQDNIQESTGGRPVPPSGLCTSGCITRGLTRDLWPRSFTIHHFDTPDLRPIHASQDKLRKQSKPARRLRTWGDHDWKRKKPHHTLGAERLAREDGDRAAAARDCALAILRGCAGMPPRCYLSAIYLLMIYDISVYDIRRTCITISRSAPCFLDRPAS